MKITKSIFISLFFTGLFSQFISKTNAQITGKKTAFLVSVQTTDVPRFDNSATAEAPTFRDNMEMVLELKGFEDIEKLPDPTGDDFLNKFSKKIKDLDKEDFIVLYFYGHGGQLPDQENGDEEDHSDETLVLKDREVRDDEIYEILNSENIKAKVLMVIEACNSGSTYMYHKYDPIINTGILITENLNSQLIKIPVAVSHDPLFEKLDESNLDMIYIGATSDGSSVPSDAFNNVFINTIAQDKFNNYKEFFEIIKEEMNQLYGVEPSFVTELASEEFINSKPFN